MQSRRFRNNFFKDLTDIIKVQKLKSDFVANVSHELRTPLQSIKLGLETINNGHAADDAESQKNSTVSAATSNKNGKYC